MDFDYDQYHAGSIVDSAKVKVMFDSDNVMVQGDIAAGGSVTSGTVYDITQKQQYRIQIDKKVYTVVWAYGYPNSFGTDATVTNGKVEIISAVKSGETETWSGIEPTDIPGANNNNQTAEGGRVAIIPGSTVTVKIVPDYGYQFIEGMLNGQAIAAQDEISTFTFTMPNTNLHLSALFTETQDVIDCTATGVTGGSIIGGENVIDSGNLQLSVTDAGISDAEKNKLKESTAASGVQVDQWLEVDLMQFVEKGDTGEQWTQDLEELKAKITITLNVGTLDTNKEYVVVREHNGAYEQIPATYNSAEGTLTFESDKFSNYAVGTKVTANDIVGTINTDMNIRA